MNTQLYHQLLSEFVSFKSISTDPAYKGEIQKTVDWLQKQFSRNGFTVQILQGKTTNPVVVAKFTADPSFKTVLVYGHYDVQPAEREDGWSTEPYELTEKDGRYIARGVVDNKGQILIHMVTVFELIKSKQLKYNVTFLIEGNEETSNPDLPLLLKEHHGLFTADHVLISDGELVDGMPAIEASLRGGFNLTLKYTTAKNNVHSGIYGGAIPNAAYELSRFLGTLMDDDNIVQVERFYDENDEITQEHLEYTNRIEHTSAKLLENAGIKTLKTEPGHTFYSQTGLRPTLQITGIKAGYIGEGYANIVPATAEVKINFRIVASQIPQKVAEHFIAYVEKHTPEYVGVKIKTDGMHNPVKVNIDSAFSKQVQSYLKKAYKTDPVIKYVGGAIPFVSDMKELFGIEATLIPLSNDDCNMHGADENFSIELIKKGLSFSHLFFTQAK